MSVTRYQDTSAERRITRRPAAASGCALPFNSKCRSQGLLRREEKADPWKSGTAWVWCKAVCSRPRSGFRLPGGGPDADVTAGAAFVFKADHTGDAGKQGIVLALADV